MAFQHKESWGSLTKNEQHEEGDKRPIMRGDAMYKGEIVNLAIWPGKPDRNGVTRWAVKIEPREKSQGAERGERSVAENPARTSPAHPFGSSMPSQISTKYGPDDDIPF